MARKPTFSENHSAVNPEVDRSARDSRSGAGNSWGNGCRPALKALPGRQPAGSSKAVSVPALPGKGTWSSRIWKDGFPRREKSFRKWNTSSSAPPPSATLKKLLERIFFFPQGESPVQRAEGKLPRFRLHRKLERMKAQDSCPQLEYDLASGTVISAPPRLHHVGLPQVRDREACADSPRDWFLGGLSQGAYHVLRVDPPEVLPETTLNPDAGQGNTRGCTLIGCWRPEVHAFSGSAPTVSVRPARTLR